MSKSLNLAGVSHVVHPSSVADDREIEQKIDFSLDEVLRKIIKLSGFTTFLAGLFIIWTLNGHVNLAYLITWYVCVCFFSVINMSWAFYFDRHQITHERLKLWRIGFYYIL